MKKGTVKRIAAILAIAMIMSAASVLIPSDFFAGIQRNVFADTFDLQAAIDAADSGTTIVLEDDVTTGITIPDGKEITINLNGYNIATSDEDAITNNGVLTIKGSGLVMGLYRAIKNYGEANLLGGVFTNNYQHAYPVINYETGTMTIENATVTSSQSKQGCYTIQNYGGLTINKGSQIKTYTIYSQVQESGSNIVNLTSGSVVINGGTFSAPRWNLFVYSYTDNSSPYGDIVINDGVFVASCNIGTWFRFVPTSGSMTINGGYFEAEKNFIGDRSRPYPILIKGGYYCSSGWFADEISAIKVEEAKVNCDNPQFVGTCSNIQLVNLTSEKEISAVSVTNGAVVNGSIIKVENPQGNEMWYAGNEATKQVRNAATGTKVSMIYGILSTTSSHDIYMTVPSSTSAYINGNAVPADGLEHIIHKDLVSKSSHPCLSPDSPRVYYCSDCEKYYQDVEGTIEVTDISEVDFVYNHTLELVPSKPATTTEEGYEAYYKCKVCGEIFSDAEGNNPIDAPVVIPKLPMWNDPTYKWADDYSTVTATHIGKNDSSLIETETVETTSTVIKPATTTETGIRKYTTKAFKNSAFEVQSKEVEIPMVKPDPSISLDKSSATIVCGKTLQLKATVKGSTSKVEWKTSDSSVVSVDANGLITAKSAGVATVSASISGGKSAICKITVTNKNNPTATPTVKPTATPTKAPTKAPSVSLSLDKKTASVVCGKGLTLKATTKGTSSAVAWKSSNSKVAQVDASGKVTTKMAGTVTITASVADKSATCTVTVLYKDVTNTKDFWFTPTNYLTAKGIVKGYANQTEFRPSNDCTRAQMLTFMWRLAGEPDPSNKTCKFPDVKRTDYFFKPVIWAVEKGITTGYSDGTFKPQNVCTRAQTVTFLWRMAGTPDPRTKKNPFPDVKTKDYFYKATLWASEKNILAGLPDGTFNPQGMCLRRQMVTFLYKYDKYINGKG